MSNARPIRGPGKKGETIIMRNHPEWKDRVVVTQSKVYKWPRK